MRTRTDTARTAPRRRGLLTGTAAVLALALALGAGTAAEAAVPGYLNPDLMRTTRVSGTDCTAHVSMWKNGYHYPGAGAYVTCGSNHTVSMAVETDWAPVGGGSWSQWGRSGTAYAGTGSVSQTVYESWAVLGGSRQWRGVAYVWVDGVYRGWAQSATGTWTAGT